jgi:hypothetical protein
VWILWLSLDVLISFSAIVRGRWVTGPTDFTVVCFGSITGLWLLRETHELLSPWATALIVGVHLFFLAGGLLSHLTIQETIGVGEALATNTADLTRRLVDSRTAWRFG